ncbi:MAG: formylglycine-generating enzyme family protein [Kiritimatiellae bacterium]|jgi:formylglycine-generating enzyme required for sulfatase activity|nr:formylglycine-generating enzyme family protein [Kiritimatiellia bacterium]
MKINNITKNLLGLFLIGLVFNTFAVEPAISRVTVHQRWPWSRLVDIDYVLSCDPTQRVDIVVNGNNGSTPLQLSHTSLSGDMYSVSEGAHRIVLDPTRTAYTNSELMTQFRVSLTPIDPPLYMIVDLTKSAGEEGQVKYVTRSDLDAGLWGAVETNPVPGVDSVIWTGVTNDSAYATDKLVLRRVKSGSFGMGASANIITTLTKDFYVGVFEVTQQQWRLIIAEWPAYFNNSTYRQTRPVENVSYNDIRGATLGGGWPGSTDVDSYSLLAKLREKTGFTDFDLPTEAQWEYACRAGTTTVFNDGNGSASVSGAYAYTNQWLDVLGRYKFNGGYVDGVTAPAQSSTPANGTAQVGSYQPNAWGIYDMHANAKEWCLDWNSDGGPSGGIDPMGPDAGSMRCNRGTGWNRIAADCSSYTRDRNASNSRFSSIGFRVILRLP